jgi:hypothetical protein
MMAYVEQWNGYAAAKVQSALGSQSSSTGATVIRQTGGVGGRMTKAAIESNEVRRDGLSTRGRHGLRKSTGTYSSEYSVGGFDDIMQAVLRGTYGTADLAITQADFTAIDRRQYDHPHIVARRFRSGFGSAT